MGRPVKRLAAPDAAPLDVMRERNAKARKAANENPDQVADAAIDSKAVQLALKSWVDTSFFDRLDPIIFELGILVDYRLSDDEKSSKPMTPDQRATFLFLLLGNRQRLLRSGHSFDMQSESAHTSDRSENAAKICSLMTYLATAKDVTDGLSMLAMVVEGMPHKVTPEGRRDKRILPRLVVCESRPERQAGMVFGGLHGGRDVEMPELPLFPEVASHKRVSILDLVDAAGVPVMARGTGAPLPSRAVRPGVGKRAAAGPAPRNRAASLKGPRVAGRPVSERMGTGARLAQTARCADTCAGLRSP